MRTISSQTYTTILATLRTRIERLEDLAKEETSDFATAWIANEREDLIAALEDLQSCID